MHGPLMTLSGDHIVDASLLKPTKKEHGTSPFLEGKKPQGEIDADPNQAAEWVQSYLQKNERVPECREF